MGNKKRTAPLVLIFALLYLFPSVNAYPQQEPYAHISGRVIDEETNNPLENVIVFLANTFCGTSTDTLGKFLLTNIESGEYDLIISRVGYSRQIKHLQIKPSDTLFYVIKLVAQPIQTGEVEILGERPESVKPKLNLFPSTKDNTFCVYGVETYTPIGILFTDSAFYMYALEPTRVDNEKYIRLWLLYFNISRKVYDFNPNKVIKLHLITKKSYYQDISALLPSEIQSSISNKSAMDTAKEIIGRQIEKMAVHQGISWKRELRFLQGHLSPEAYAHYVALDIIRGPISGIALDNILTQSINDGILKQHIVYPDNGVHGFLYFPYPGLEWKTSKNKFDEAFENQYELEIITPTETKTIVFTPY